MDGYSKHSVVGFGRSVSLSPAENVRCMGTGDETNHISHSCVSYEASATDFNSSRKTPEVPYNSVLLFVIAFFGLHHYLAGDV